MPVLTLTNNLRILETQALIVIPALALNQPGIDTQVSGALLLINTKNTSQSPTKNIPLDIGGFVNQSLLLLGEKLKHNSRVSSTQNKLFFWRQCSPCIHLSFATIRTGTRSQTEGQENHQENTGSLTVSRSIEINKFASFYLIF